MYNEEYNIKDRSMHASVQNYLLTSACSCMRIVNNESKLSILLTFL